MDFFESMDAARRRFAERAERLAQATAELAGRRYTAIAGGGDVRASVDGNAQLLEIELTRGSEPVGHRSHLLGKWITEAVNDARRQAAQGGRDLLVWVLGTEQSADDLMNLTGVTVPAPESEPNDPDDYFEDLSSHGFLR